MWGNEQARREIQSFLKALNSYPERFAKDPDVTFEQYCASLIVPERRESSGAKSPRPM